MWSGESNIWPQDAMFPLTLSRLEVDGLNLMATGRKDFLWCSVLHRGGMSLLLKVLLWVVSTWWRGWVLLSRMLCGLHSILLSPPPTKSPAGPPGWSQPSWWCCWPAALSLCNGLAIDSTSTMTANYIYLYLCIMDAQWLAPTTPSHNANTIHTSTTAKFADNTTVEGLITKCDESAYREEVQRLTEWCTENILSLNIKKPKSWSSNTERSRTPTQHTHQRGEGRESG